MSRFDYAKHDKFNVELGVLIQKYLDFSDVDPMSLFHHLNRRADQIKTLGVIERQKFREDQLRKEKNN